MTWRSLWSPFCRMAIPFKVSELSFRIALALHVTQSHIWRIRPTSIQNSILAVSVANMWQVKESAMNTSETSTIYEMMPPNRRETPVGPLSFHLLHPRHWRGLQPKAMMGANQSSTTNATAPLSQMTGVNRWQITQQFDEFLEVVRGDSSVLC